MAKKAKKPGGKFRGLGVFFIILGILFILPALPLTIEGGIMTVESFGYKHEMTALPSFDSLAEKSYYTANLESLIKFGEREQAVASTEYSFPVEYYYIEAADHTNQIRYLVVEVVMPDTITTAKTFDSVNRDGLSTPPGLFLKITGILESLPDSHRTALFENMTEAGIVADEAEFSEMLLPYMLVEMPVDQALYLAIAGIVLLLIAVLFFILAGVMFRKSRRLIEAAEIEAAKKMDFSKMRQPDSEKFFSSGDDIDNLVAETPSFPKKSDPKDDDTYKPKVPVPAPEAAPDDLDLSNLDFSSLKPPEETEDPLF
ncbi:MAG: hypothetical protein LBL87_00415 [Ruminococcus sp.]|jgi:hypothetical protein|nr:hypothetical protein [Ruminococcus sp.]